MKVCKAGQEALAALLKRISAVNAEKDQNVVFSPLSIHVALVLIPGGVGVVARDDKGRVILTSWRVIFNANSPAEVEWLACHEGVNLAAEWVRDRVIVETDSSLVASMLREHSFAKSKFCFIGQDIEARTGDLPEVCFQAVRRGCNRAAHELAQLAKQTAHTAVWRSGVPQCIKHLVTQDCNFDG
ncbi:hypothetical protein PR202_gb25602 [Eleusine coracana subsp. coracana]|uniref:RNase H type-1 domain-containing protein n=1 Tax=Eleusine coracana subsp. coracana TaxID=191504 RepID=A0AAV5FPN6_ELECO|nr:hypothetical protein PR202_gb25602 [Eleusine coracana subsp. coracana]